MTVRKGITWAVFFLTSGAFLLAACRVPAAVSTPQSTPAPAATAPPSPSPSVPTATPKPTPTSAPTPALLPTPMPTATVAPPTPQATVSLTPSPAPSTPRATATPAPAGKPDPQAGEKTFYAVGCIGCHTVQGVGGRVGPDLTDIAKRRDAAYIRQSEVDPKAYIVPGYPPVMPSAAEMGLNAQDVENIIAWFQSLR